MTFQIWPCRWAQPNRLNQINALASASTDCGTGVEFRERLINSAYAGHHRRRVMATQRQIFLSYAGDDAFEASLLQYAIEHLLAEQNVTVWTFQRDQSKSERQIAKSLKARVEGSQAMIFLVSPSTLDSGAAQWMELAYSDAFCVPISVILHRLSYAQVKARKKGVQPFLLESQCNPSSDWRSVVEAMGRELDKAPSTRPSKRSPGPRAKA
jgi:hypothetical protein